MSTPIHRLRIIGMVEGISFLALLGIAMPLKYLKDMPMAVTIVGAIHGLLFLVFCYALLEAAPSFRRKVFTSVVVFIAAVVPFGPFVIDRKLREEEQQELGSE